MYMDGTFFVAPDFNYLVFIIKNLIPRLNEFYTISFSTLRNKEHET